MWQEEEDLSGEPTKRHEACFVMVNGKGYLIGGRDRGERKHVDIYDPSTKTWTEGSRLPIELHHMQCIEHDEKVWILSSWTNNDRVVGLVRVYDTVTDTWSTREGLPSARARGSSAAVKVGSGAYVIGGNRGGHGEQGTAYPWVDYYNFDTGSWITGLANLPDARDHSGAALLYGKMVCVSSGRDSGVANFFSALKFPTYCFDVNVDDPSDITWRNMEADIPTGRAGSAVGTLCDGRMAVVGGESGEGAHKEVEVFDGVRWTKMHGLRTGRHGTGLAVSNCDSCGLVFVASGSGGRGGGPELTSTEVFSPDGRNFDCEGF